MELSRIEEEHIISTIAPLVALDWHELSTKEKATLLQDLREKVLPILHQLPTHQTMEGLEDKTELFRRAALDLIVERLQKVQAYRNETVLEIITRIKPDDLHKYATHLKVLTQAALTCLPQPKTLIDLIEELPTWDADQALQQLIEDSES